MKDCVPPAPLERFAWFNLIVFATTVALYIVAVPGLAWYFHRTLAAAALPSLGLFGMCGLWGFGSYFLYDRKRRARVKLDERENSIYLRAGTIGFAVSWQVFVFLCMGVWAVVSYGYHRTTIPVGFLPFLVFLDGAVVWVTQSIAILVQYKRSAADVSL
jgi:hypothetical protein